MAQLQSYQERVGLMSAKGAGANLQNAIALTAGDFDRRQNADLLNAVLGFGKAAAGAYNNYVETKAIEAGTQFQKELSAEKIRYMSENQGENALNAAEHFKTFAEQKQAEYIEKLPGGQQYFGKMTAASTLHFTETGYSYGHQQKNAWEKSVLNSAMAEYDQTVAGNYNNSEYIEAQSGILKQQIAAMQPGLDHRGTFAEIDKRTVSNRLGAFLANNDVASAKALFAAQGTLLGDRADEAMGQIRRVEEHNIAKANVYKHEKIREIQDMLPDAEFQAGRTGNVDALRSAASELARLGNARAAERITRHANMYADNAEALQKSLAMPLGDAANNYAALGQSLENITDPHEYKAKAAQLEVLGKSIQARAKVFKDDPAKAVDTGIQYNNMGALAEDRLNAQAINGIPLGARKILTVAEKEPLALAWQQGTPEQRLAVAQQIGNYGEYAQQVGAEIGMGFSEQTALAQVQNDPYAVTRAATIITAANQKPENLPKIEKADELTRTAQENSAVYSAHAHLAKTLTDNVSVQGNVREMQKTLHNMVRINGGDGDLAAKTLDGSLSKSIKDKNHAIYFAPTETSENIITRGLSEFIEANLAEFVDGLPFASKFAKADYIYHLKNKGIWANAPDGKGYILMDPVSKAHVTNAKGRTFRATDADFKGTLAGEYGYGDIKIYTQ